jgi:hypothetical protein
MEVVTIEISKDLLQKLVDNKVVNTCDFKVKKVDVTGFDYSQNERWLDCKMKADKAYKNLKRLEFEIRYNIK